MAVVETLMLDARHKLYLIRRDETEHLIVLGPQGAATIESGMPVLAAHETPTTGHPS
jgi:flagellar protein FliO/FliZ